MFPPGMKAALMAKKSEGKSPMKDAKKKTIKDRMINKLKGKAAREDKMDGKGGCK